jgi:hypothetical protein
MNQQLKKQIDLYVQLLKNIAKSDNVSTEEKVKALVILGKIIAKEEAYRYENNLINPLHD